jgi:2-isopropylmalate synthase
VGYSTPDELRDFFVRIRERVPNSDRVIFSAHCHDDLGLAVANTLAAVQGGARQVECTINGIGERAGNAAVEEIVMALQVRRDRMPFTTTVDTKQLYPSSEMLTRLTGQAVQVNKAIVGRNAFAHEAGIHQDGILKDRRTYEIMSATDVGAPWNPLVLGKHSGRHAVQKRCAELGFALEGDELVEVYRAIMTIADDRKIVTETDIRAVIGRLRSDHVSASDAVDPFDTPSTGVHAMNESGYGHGV